MQAVVWYDMIRIYRFTQHPSGRERMADDEGFHLVRELAADCIEMLVNVGIIDSISDRWPPEVQDNWRQKIEQLRDNVNSTTAEVQEFASTWDDQAAS